MAKIHLELERKDFNPTHFSDFEKGYVSLSYKHLNPEIYKYFVLANDAYIMLGEDKYYLKQK